MTRWIRASDGSYIPDPSVPRDRPLHPLHSALLDAIEEFHTSSYNAFALNIRVTPHSCTDYRFHFEFSWCVSRDRLLAIRIPRNIETVQVRLNQRWIPLTDYLQTEADRDLSNPNLAHHIDPFTARRLQIEHQQSWWAANGKVFDFMNLPLELRERIYHFSSPEEAIEPYAKHFLRDCVPLRTKYQNDIVTGLLNAHPQISFEMRRYMFRTLSMKVPHFRLLSETFVENPAFPKYELTQVILCLGGHSEYFHLFGLKGRDTNTGMYVMDLPLTTVKALGKFYLPCLKRLEIVVPDRKTLEDEDFLARGCQNGATELWLERMWHWVAGQPLVLTGMVKKSTKLAWEEKARQGVLDWETQFEDQEDGGVPVDKEKDKEIGVWLKELHDRLEEIERAEEIEYKLEEEEPMFPSERIARELLEEIEKLPLMDLPPRCNCAQPCRSGEWSDE